MKQNEGTTDRILRLAVGIAFLIVAFLALDAAAASAGGIALAAIGAVLLVTAATGFCVGYKLFNYSTNK